MDIEELKKEIIADEGYENSIYMCSENKATVGVGHMILESDPEHNLEVGTHIDDERVNELFEKDIETTIAECKKLYYDFDELPDEAQHIIANMMFNLGRPRLSRFHKMKRAVDNREWSEAANQMYDSRWRKQVPNRAERLIERMKSISL